MCCADAPISVPTAFSQVNVVVMRGVNDDEIGDFVELTRHDPINVRFIEYMPFDGNAWGSNKMVPYRELMAAVNSRWVQVLDVCWVCVVYCRCECVGCGSMLS